MVMAMMTALMHSHLKHHNGVITMAMVLETIPAESKVTPVQPFRVTHQVIQMVTVGVVLILMVMGSVTQLPVGVWQKVLMPSSIKQVSGRIQTEMDLEII